MFAVKAVEGEVLETDLKDTPVPVPRQTLFGGSVYLSRSLRARSKTSSRRR